MLLHLAAAFANVCVLFVEDVLSLKNIQREEKRGEGRRSDEKNIRSLIKRLGVPTRITPETEILILLDESECGCCIQKHAQKDRPFVRERNTAIQIIREDPNWRGTIFLAPMIWNAQTFISRGKDLQATLEDKNATIFGPIEAFLPHIPRNENLTKWSWDFCEQNENDLRTLMTKNHFTEADVFKGLIASAIATHAVRHLLAPSS